VTTTLCLLFFSLPPFSSLVVQRLPLADFLFPPDHADRPLPFWTALHFLMRSIRPNPVFCFTPKFALNKISLGFVAVFAFTRFSPFLKLLFSRVFLHPWKDSALWSSPRLPFFYRPTSTCFFFLDFVLFFPHPVRSRHTIHTLAITSSFHVVVQSPFLRFKRSGAWRTWKVSSLSGLVFPRTIKPRVLNWTCVAPTTPRLFLVTMVLVCGFWVSPILWAVSYKPRKKGFPLFIPPPGSVFLICPCSLPRRLRLTPPCACATSFSRPCLILSACQNTRSWPRPFSLFQPV